ncbi:MAG: alpha/beta fold hydrolase [Candidatus Omnitrophica bacterium]|nr:alpha/beta fold hydrolase [Candidatus Omnitrophota bacterium]
MIALALAGMVATTDGVNIAYDHYKNGFDSVVIVCPGFFNSKKNSFMKKTVEIVSSSYDVIIFDFRGHGESGGKFTWTSTEPLDLGAVLDYAAGCGYKKIGVIGFSLGAATAMNVAVNRPEIKSMILISAPFSFWDMNYHFWEPEMLSDLMANFECKWEGKGAKLDNIFLPKVKPIKSVAEIKEIPMLFIHGDRDWVIKDYHSRKLYDAAVTKNKRLAILHNGFHAERLIEKYPDRMKELMLGWFKETLL